MKRGIVSIVIALLVAAGIAAGPASSWAAMPPGADLVDLAWSKEQGAAVLSRFELFRSVDGKEWLPAGFSDRAVELTAVGLGKGLTVVATKPGMLLVSVDGGAFQEVKAPKDPFGRTVEGIRTIAVHPKDEEILASSGQGLVRSRDKGKTWEAIADPFWSNPQAREVIAVGYAGSDPVVVTRNGAWRQAKGGFEPITKGLPESVTPTVASVFDGNILMALPGEGIYLATKDSKWSKLKGAPGDPIAFLGFARDGYLAARVASPLHLGDPKGSTWKPVGQYSSGFIPRRSISAPFGDILILRGKGLVRLEGESFVPVALPADLSSVNTRLVSQGVQLAGTQGGVFLSSSAGQVWEDVTPEDLGSAINVFLPLGDGRILLGSDGAGVWVSGDNGRTWKDWSLRLGTSNTIKGLVRYKDGVLAGTENGLMWTETGPEPNWSSLDGGVGRRSVISLVEDAGVYWLAAQDGVYRATNGQDFSPVPGTQGRVNSLAADGGKAAALVNCQIVVIDRNLKVTKLAPFASCIASAVGVSGNDVYAGTSDGYYRYDGSRWIREAGLHYPVVKIFRDSDGMRVVTRGGGTRYLK